MALSGITQEGLICLAAYEKTGSVIVGAVPTKYYEGYHRKVADKVYGFWHKYKKPPGKAHLIDLFEELCELDPDEEEAYKRVYDSLVANKGKLNVEYILGKAAHFVQQQRIKVAVKASAPFITSGDIDQVKSLLLDALRSTDALFHPGMQITDVRTIFNLLSYKPESFPTGIKEIDAKELGPARKELWLFLAAAKRGKTQALAFVGKAALQQHLKVLHVTLEMSEERMAQRYLQALFSVSKRKANFSKMKFKTDEFGSFLSMEEVDLPNRPSFEDDDIQSRLTRRVKRFQGRFELWIKQFPTGMLTIPQLKGYLDQLEVTQGFIPDLLILDYTDLMHVDTANRREGLGKLTQDLRGIAVERNIAVATACQSNRLGAKASTVTEVHAADDWSKIATADVIVMFSQTESEKKLGLARLRVLARNDESQFDILLTQNYGLGQFSLGSARMSNKYENILKEMLIEVASRGGTDEEKPKKHKPTKKQKGIV